MGSGKSQALCHEAIRQAYTNPECTGLIGAPTYPMLRDATQTALFDILAKNHVPFEFNKADATLYLTDVRSRILFRSVDDYERLRGTNLACFGLDELTYCPEEAWLRLEGRLRDPKAKYLCGFGVWTPKGFDWVYQRFIDNPPAGYGVVRARPHENQHLLKSIPDYYERLERSFTKADYQQEALGEYLVAQSGRVYTEFSRHDHVREIEVSEYLPLHWALDFNIDPMCSVVVQIEKEEVQVLDEIVIRGASTHLACEEFLNRYGHLHGDVLVYGDSSGHQRSSKSQKTDFDIIKSYLDRRTKDGTLLNAPNQNPAVRDRVNLVNGKLRNARGDVELVVHQGCRELIKDFEQVTYKPGTTQIDKDRDQARTHLSDALGYLLWANFRQRMKAGERRERLF